MPVDGIWLYLATDVERTLVPATIAAAYARKPRIRLAPRNPARAAEYLDIVRGYKIVPLPPPPRIGITDLPSRLIYRILDSSGSNGINTLESVMGNLDLGIVQKPIEEWQAFALCASFYFTVAWFCVRWDTKWAWKNGHVREEDNEHILLRKLSLQIPGYCMQEPGDMLTRNDKPACYVRGQEDFRRRERFWVQRWREWAGARGDWNIVYEYI
ncbi:hypothetical protein TWF694_007889 [Orbilia ellipsospora]|uniref:Uncharacterized protein n=1 Tax=Orbilia ellipsospora TaxID=2528407 RepID=A0AAV9XMG1_9PEZI